MKRQDTTRWPIASRMDPAGQPVHRGHIHQSTIAQKYTQSKEEHVHTLYCWCGQNKPRWGPSRIWYRLVPSRRDCQHTVLIQSQGKYRVTFDSDINNQFIVHPPDGTQQILQQSSRGLYFLDTSLTPQPVHGTRDTVLVTTVADNANNFSNAVYSQAVLARKLQKIIGRPTTRAFIYFIENNLLPNCPVNRRDVLRAEQIFGPDIGSLKGKTI